MIRFGWVDVRVWSLEETTHTHYSAHFWLDLDWEFSYSWEHDRGSHFDVKVGRALGWKYWVRQRPLRVSSME